MIAATTGDGGTIDDVVVAATAAAFDWLADAKLITNWMDNVQINKNTECLFFCFYLIHLDNLIHYSIYNFSACFITMPIMFSFSFHSFFFVNYWS